MNDLFIQTLIFSSITLTAIFVGLHYLRKMQPRPEDNELKQQLSSLSEQVSTQLAEISSLKESLASANATKNHLEESHRALPMLRQQLEEKESLLSNQKVEVSKLTAQVTEKCEQLSQLKDQHLVTQSQCQKLQNDVSQLGSDKAELIQKLKQFEEIREELASMRAVVVSKDEVIAELRVGLSADQEAQKAMQEKIELLERSEKRLVTQFENAAHKIFKEKTGDINSQNKESLDALLTPLKEQISGFSKQVNDVYANEAKERHALKQEVSSLKELNTQMSKEATALTRALKGDNKKQGTWGEVVLERVLQESGLRSGHEYETQVNLKDSDGASYKPDIIVHLPGNKDVVIDSKMALTAYEKYYNAEDKLARKVALSEHIKAIKEHIKQLSGKNYHDLHGIKTLDYVLMFIPVEPAFNTAIEQDSELVQLALEKNIMLVSPTNLIVALKTINNMWRVEYQNQNAQEIANKAGAIYDKLVGFVDDMKKLGNYMQRAEVSYGDAMKKLSEGRGNLISRAEGMKGLRIANNKELPSDLIEKSEVTELVVNG